MFITWALIQSALELGIIYGIIALALFLTYSMLNVCDLSTDGYESGEYACRNHCEYRTLYGKYLYHGKVQFKHEYHRDGILHDEGSDQGYFSRELQ